MSGFPRFREDKAADMACRFLQRHGGTMSYLKLLKLMYIAERRAILTWGRSITFDDFVSMRRGPVLSRTYDLITDEWPPNAVVSVFQRRIRVYEPYRVESTDDETPECSPLSQAEMSLIDTVYEEFGEMDKWELVKETHKFPEWDDPAGSSSPISIRAILQRNGMPAPKVKAILSDLDALAFAEEVFAGQ